jgi:hypothetical protein
VRENRLQWFFRLVQGPGRHGSLLPSPGIPAALTPFATELHTTFRGGPLTVAAEPQRPWRGYPPGRAVRLKYLATLPNFDMD